MPRRTAQDAARTRAAVLAAAKAAFTERGYAGASTAAIARGAGVTEGALFHHFASKTLLFREVFVALEDELNRHAQAASREGEPIDAFLAGCRASLEFCLRPDFRRIVMVDGPIVLGDAGWREVDSRMGLNTVVRGLRNIAGNDRLSRTQAKPLAVLVFGALNEIIFALARDEPDLDVDVCLRHLERMIRTLLAVER
jgi:AcrR family transcriptional regulator